MLPSCVGVWSALTHLDLNQIMMPEWHQLPITLEEISIVNPPERKLLREPIDEFDWTDLVRFANLRRLKITGARLSGTLPLAFWVLSPSSLPTIEELDLSGNILSGDIPENFFVDSKGLTHVNLTSNRLTGSIPEQRFGVLSQLSLRSNRLTRWAFFLSCVRIITESGT